MGRGPARRLHPHGGDPGRVRRPTVFCGWYAFFDGYHYDAFPQLVILAAANVIDGSITIPNTDYFCDVFNIAGEIDDFQANPTESPRHR